MEKVLTTEEFKSMIENAEKPILVDFFASWCGPCKMLAPVLEDIEKEFGESFDIVKIDIDKCADLAREYDVMSVPTMMLFVGGEQKCRETGFMPKDRVLEMISSNSNVSLSK